MQKTYRVGIYCRLSRDDNNGNSESMSIANQKQILTDFVQEKGWKLTETYLDDGFSGTNFQRPDFQRLLRDIELGRINCVVVKDLSRLGRNYAGVGYYQDDYFPEHDVRFIAINEGVDTKSEFDSYNDMSAIHNVFNEFYPREVSRKVKQVKRANAAKGMFMNGRPSYGYTKSPTDKHQLVIDENVSGIVKRIFQLFSTGMTGRAIANLLNQEGVVCPRAYHYQQLARENPKKENMTWGSATILQMIDNPIYIGTLVQCKRQSVSFKSKKRRVTSPEEWITVENCHEPIISMDLWEAVRAVRIKGQTTRSPVTQRQEAIFGGLVRCADCGAVMAAAVMGRNKRLTYRCGTYNNHGKSVCTTHSIHEEDLHAVILHEIHTYAKLANDDKELLIKRVVKALNVNSNQETSLLTKQLSNMKNRMEQLQAASSNIYLDKAVGKISESLAFNLLSGYEKELQELSVQYDTLSHQLSEMQTAETNIRTWADMIEEYLSVKQLDRNLARALVDKIAVSEKFQHNGETVQKISITYRFVGNLPAISSGKTEDVA